MNIKKLLLCVLFLVIAFNVSAELPKPLFKLRYPGKSRVLDYTKYGKFKNIGTNKYRYVIKKEKRLARDVGEGIMPNEKSVYKDRLYRKLKSQGKLKGSHWNHIYTDNPAADFFVWATAQEEPGVKLFFTANALKEAGLILHAIKAYYAILVHSPRSACYSADGSFVWYVAPVAIDKIISLCRKYPELGVKLVDAHVEVKNGGDLNLNNDRIKTNPGYFVKIKPGEKVDLKELDIKEQIGEGKVKLVEYENGHWQMLVDDKPFFVKGITYSPTKIGESPANNTMRSWMFVDDNGNGLIDAPYESWVDTNGNMARDEDEKIIGDFQLLKDMGCNAIRYYHGTLNNEYNPKEFNKELLRELHAEYGISVIMGDFLGAYTVGSGATWEEGTDYTNREQCENMKKVVRDWVMDHKDEPYVLMWLLGNENNMSGDYAGVNATRTQASKHPEAYTKFLNEVAEMIHEIDKDHPVAVGNLSTGLIDYYDKYAPAIDILGINHYADKDGFGALWQRVKRMMDRPILITEYGCDAYDTNKKSIDENGQALWHEGCWQDIAYNEAGGNGDGNVIGAVIFEWIDEWWKSLKGDPFTQQKTSDAAMAFPDGASSEEWLGIVSQGDGKNSPYLRHLRKTYHLYKKMWNKKSVNDSE